MKRTFLLIVLCSSYVTASDNDALSIGNLRQSFHDAIHKNNTAGAIQVMARLQLLVHADWKYFNDDQIEAWQEISGRYCDKITRLGITEVRTRIQNIKEEEARWLLRKINEPGCKIDWSVLLGHTNFLAKSMQENRMRELSSIGQLRPTKKRKFEEVKLNV